MIKPSWVHFYYQPGTHLDAILFSDGFIEHYALRSWCLWNWSSIVFLFQVREKGKKKAEMGRQIIELPAKSSSESTYQTQSICPSVGCWGYF